MNMCMIVAYDMVVFPRVLYLSLLDLQREATRIKEYTLHLFCYVNKNALILCQLTLHQNFHNN